MFVVVRQIICCFTVFQEQVQNFSQQLVQGHLNLLSLCPQEVAHLRKELLIAAKHILATDLRNSEFLSSMLAANQM